MCDNLSRDDSHQLIRVCFINKIVPIDTADPPEKIPSTYFTVVRQLNHTPYPVGFYDNAQNLGIKLEITKTERSLLNYLIGKYTYTMFYASKNLIALIKFGF